MATKSTTTKINLQPTAGYILIDSVTEEKKTASGLYLPDNATGEKPQKGRIIAVGDDEVTENGTKRTSPAKVGDEVIYKKWGGNEVKIDGKEYLFVKFDDILAIVK
jgi:chaperonin GroES